MVLNGTLTITAADLTEYNRILAAILANDNYELQTEDSDLLTITITVDNAPR